MDADVSDPAQVQHLIDQTVQQFGKIDIFINNAGIEHKHPITEFPIEQWNSIIAVNLTGPFLCIQAAANQMIKQGQGGRIINISSIHEDLPMPGNAPYCASKGGLRMLMRTVCVELAPHNITVNNIGPGAIFTPHRRRHREQSRDGKGADGRNPRSVVGASRRMSRPWRCSWPATADRTAPGSTFFIDGGMLRQAGGM